MSQRPLAAVAAALALGSMLSGCIAAVVPVAAAGAIGKRKTGGAKRQEAPTPVAAAVVPAETGLRLLPAGSTLPPPDGALPKPAPAPEAGWRALVRHVARAMTAGASCPDGTTAVLIDASVAQTAAAERDAAVASINALRTMGASVTFVAPDPAAARAALNGAGMAETDTKVATVADVRGIARSGCVVASGGGTRETYTGLAWFALPSAGAAVAAKELP